ncbi:hypothetical protein M407DRAFT_24531 [Tulasnella calospora MUT 4182]|uniref:Uncharacterized protein n=1 Tax=Tulasnella calospora MUT 4182 TaxID=1051891 RepID=A0A0C3Q8N0_9AGAM|nr:hypothetical protein M407DRAFT_24531 [Tulasnella calospora MUT 4182]
MPKSSAPDFTPQQYKNTSSIIKPVAKLKISIIGDLLISGGLSSGKAARSLTSSKTHLNLRPGVGKFVTAIIKQMQKTEDNYKNCIKGDAVELGLHWLFGHSLQQLVQELKWTTKKGQKCLYQSIWNLIILWAGNWPGDPFSCSLFKRACKKAGLKEFSKAQFECALKICEKGRAQIPDADSILPLNPEDYEPLFLTFEGGNGTFEDLTLMFGYDQNPPVNTDIPLYTIREQQRDSRDALGDNQVPASAAQESENSGIPMDDVQEESGQSALGVGPDGGNISNTSDAIHQRKDEYIPTGLDLNTSNTHPGGGKVAAGTIGDFPVTAAQPSILELALSDIFHEKRWEADQAKKLA